MTSTPAGVDQVFILRFWRENADSSNEFRWRVQVRDVNTRQRYIANDVESALALVVERLKATESDA